MTIIPFGNYDTVPEASAALGVTPKTIRDYIANGKIKAIMIGRDWLIETGQYELVKVRSVGRPKKETI
jgi:excisionase family DNA binding protein